MKKLTSALAVTALVAAGAAATLSPAEADSAAAANYRVTLKASAQTAIAKEDAITLKGRVRPTPAAGSKVSLQLQYEGKHAWKTIKTTKVGQDGKYSFTDKPTTRLDRTYRVVKTGDGKAAKGISRGRLVEVSGWAWLSQLVTSADKNVFSTGEMPINGENYRNTLFLDRLQDSGFREWTLGRRCTDLDATFGLSDRTETGGMGAVVVKLDGVAEYSQTFGLGASETPDIDVTDVYRLRIDFLQNTATPDNEPSAGAARVLCD